MDHLPRVDVTQPRGRNTVTPGCCWARLPYVAGTEFTKKGFSLPELPEKKPTLMTGIHLQPWGRLWLP